MPWKAPFIILIFTDEETNAYLVRLSQDVTEKGGGVVHDKLLQKRFPPFCLWRFLSPRPPARFAMPAARGKTSLNARDW